jgi:hypothetical protein
MIGARADDPTCRATGLLPGVPRTVVAALLPRPGLCDPVTLGEYLRSDDIDRSAAYGARALCSRWTRTRTTGTGRTRTLPEMGEILFVAPLIDHEVISHEVAHAAIGWAQRIGIRPFGTGTDCQYAGPDEERYCYALGRMVLQVTERVAALR